jgi:hypothetical protein
LPLLGESQVLVRDVKILVRDDKIVGVALFRFLERLFRTSSCVVDLVGADRNRDDEREPSERLRDAAPRLNAELGELLLTGDPGAAPVLYLPARDEPDCEPDDDQREQDRGDEREIFQLMNAIAVAGSSCRRDPDVHVVAVLDVLPPEDLRAPLAASC